jgi:DNA-binding response OmpR family regulator
MLTAANNLADRIDVEVVVVDTHTMDYAEWAHTSPARIVLCATAGEALKYSSLKPLLWIIHSQLPDLSGLELYGKLNTLGRQSTSILVTDRYDAAQELAALSQGSLIYQAKPLDFAQLDRLSNDLITRFSDKSFNTQKVLQPIRT